MNLSTTQENRRLEDLEVLEMLLQPGRREYRRPKWIHEQGPREHRSPNHIRQHGRLEHQCLA